MSELDRKQAERAQTNGRYPLAHEAPAGTYEHICGKTRHCVCVIT